MRGIGRKISRGDYIVNYNTDDHLFQSALQTYVSYINELPDIDLFYGPCLVTSEEGALISMRSWPEYSHQTLKELCICGPFPCVKKTAIEEAGYFNTKYASSADYDMWLKLSSLNKKFKRIEELVGSFCYREGSVSNSTLLEAQADDREIQSKY